MERNKKKKGERREKGARARENLNNTQSKSRKEVTEDKKWQNKTKTHLFQSSDAQKGGVFQKEN